ncbi:MAG: hypothetical protein V4456_20275 [Bacteroidota bacterium]
MILFLNYTIFIIELICLIRLVSILGVKNLYTLFYFAVFYYAQAVFLDYIVFGKDNILTTSRVVFISPKNPDFLYATLCYYLFLQTFYFLALKSKKIIKKANDNSSQVLRNISFQYSFVLILLAGYNLYTFVSHFGLQRNELGGEQTPVTLILYNTAIYTGIFTITGFKKQNIASLIYIVVLAVYLLFSFEREPVLIAGLIILFKYGQKINDKLLIFLMPLGILILAFYKLFFSTFLYTGGTGLAGFQGGVNETEFSFAGIDPLSSFAILCDYFNHNIYEDYTLSYITNFYGQAFRMFFGGDYKSISEYASMYYTYGTYGMAFSMIMESLLNFSYFGPIVLAFAISKIYNRIYKKRSEIFISLLVIATFICIKLIRTEVMTLLKIQIVPALISYYLFNYLNKRKIVS